MNTAVFASFRLRRGDDEKTLFQSHSVTRVFPATQGAASGFITVHSQVIKYYGISLCDANCFHAAVIEGKSLCCAQLKVQNVASHLMKITSCKFTGSNFDPSRTKNYQGSAKYF